MAATAIPVASRGKKEITGANQGFSRRSPIRLSVQRMAPTANTAARYRAGKWMADGTRYPVTAPAIAAIIALYGPAAAAATPKGA